MTYKILHLSPKKILRVDDFFDFIKKDWDKSYYFIFLFLAFAIALNYYFDLEDSYLDIHSNSFKGILLFFALNVVMYIIPLFSLLKLEMVQKAVKNHQFWFSILLALLLLSFNQSTNFSTLFFSEWHYESYFNRKIGTRLSSLVKYAIIFVILGIILGKSKEKIYGLFEFNINYKTYFWFIIIMLPLIIFASTQESFLSTYPKFKQGNVPFNEYSQQLLFFEPLYLINFIGIEWFFRGFMVLFFAKFLNHKSVVLVAMIYCSFHFGKPILECISSFFGGYLLGYMVYKSKSIWGGVIVHMGIAFLMDFTAFIASSY